MFTRSRAVCSLLGVLILFFLLPNPVFASDDSNTGNLALASSTWHVSSATRDAITGVAQLSQGVNDSQYQQLAGQLESQLQKGDNAGAVQTLSQLKSYTNSSQGAGLPASVKDLVQSLTPGSNGISVDSSRLLQLLGTPDASGLPAGLNGMNPATAALNLASLSGLLQGSNPRGAISLATESRQLQTSLPSNALGELSHGVNNTQYQQIVGQLETQLQKGDNAGAVQTLAQLKNYTSSIQGAGLPASVKDLVQSLGPQSSGVSLAAPQLLQQLSQGVNDAQYQQMVGQLESQLQKGNNSATVQTLSQLKNYTSSSQAAGLPASVKDLVQNLTPEYTGVSTDAPTLLQKLSQGVNDTQYQQMVGQLEGQLQQGDNAGAAHTLSQLKNYTSSPQGAGLPAPVKEMVQSLSAQNNGISADTSQVLQKLSQGVNDAQYEQMAGQLESQLQKGDNAGAAATLSQLKSYANSSQGIGLPASAKDLVQSLSPQSKGVSADAPQLLSKLSQGVNDAQYQQMAGQLQGQLQTGNYAGAAQTLSQLKSYTNSSQGAGLPAAVKDLVQNLTPQTNGISVDTPKLSQLLGAPDANGMPAGLKGMDNAKAAQDLSTLSSLLQGKDTSDALNLATDSRQLESSLPFPATVSPSTKAAVTGLDHLSQGVNDIPFQQMVGQLEGQIKKGDNAGAGQTLGQLKDYVNSPQGAGVPPLAKDFVQSLNSQNNGMSLDSSQFLKTLGDPNTNGMPSALDGKMDPLTAAKDMSKLAKDIQGTNPAAALKLAEEADQIQKSIDSGALPGGSSSGSQQPFKLPPVDVNNLAGPGSNPVVPTLPNTASPLSTISPAVSALGLSPGKLNLTTLTPIIVIVALAATLIILRKRHISLPRRIGRVGRLEKPEVGLNLKNPRDLIIFYFRKAVAAMRKRGLPRLQHETHREFSTKCSARPESEHISPLSMLYEKAMFSGREASQGDADEARDHASIVEKGPPDSSSKERTSPFRFIKAITGG